MTNIAGIVIREHSEQKFVKKFPMIVPWALLTLSGASIALYYWLLCQYNISIGWSLLILFAGLCVAVLSLGTMPSYVPEEYLIEITPRMSAIDWLVIAEDFNIINEGMLLYRCRRKVWKL